MEMCTGLKLVKDSVSLVFKEIWICVLWSDVEGKCKAAGLLVTMGLISLYAGHVSACRRCMEHTSVILGCWSI
jgi:hypothetical protein